MGIREAEHDDAEALSRLAIETYHAAFGHSMSAADLDSHLKNHLQPEQFERFLDRDTVLVAEIDGRLVGYAQYGPANGALEQASGQDWELYRLYVHPDFQNRGVGSQLMQAALSDPGMAAAPHIFLDVWERNTGAIRFYERYGFKVVGARKFAVESGAETDPDLIMARDKGV